MNTTNRPPILRERDDHGTTVVRVPLDRHGGRWATLDAADFDQLPASLSRTWFLNENGSGNAYVKARASGLSGNLVLVARVALAAGRGQIVRFRNGDRCDMRRRNAQLTRDRRAKRDHRAEILAAAA